MSNNNNNEIKDIELSAEVARGNYINTAVVGHSNREFIMDFISMLPGFPRPMVLDRIITTPETAKRILIMLQDNIKKYETSFGEIELEEESNEIPIGFGNPNAKA